MCSLLIPLGAKGFEVLDLPLDFSEVAVNLLEANQVFSSFGVPYSIVLLDEMIGEDWFFEPPCQFFERRRFDVAL